MKHHDDWWNHSDVLPFNNRSDRSFRYRANRKQRKLEQKLTKIKTRKKNKLNLKL